MLHIGGELVVPNDERCGLGGHLRRIGAVGDSEKRLNGSGLLDPLRDPLRLREVTSHEGRREPALLDILLLLSSPNTRSYFI